MNIRRVTFETDIHNIESLRNKLCITHVNKSMKTIEPEYEEKDMDEVRALLDEIINADITAKYRIKTL
jgi:hypothetical protein